MTKNNINIKKPIIENVISRTWESVPFEMQNIKGELGRRIENNYKSLLNAPIDGYLKVYENQRDHRFPMGEFLGKYVQSFLFAYLYTTNDKFLNRAKKIVDTWIEADNGDGYIVTKPIDCTERWSGEWEIWELKYVIIALVYYNMIADYAPAMDLAKKIGTLLYDSFGYEEGKMDIMSKGVLRLGTSSVLEAMVYLYRYTGEKKYFDFCEYIMQAHEQEPNGTKAISEMLSERKDLFYVGGPGPWHKNKTYEMLSSYIGILRMYELTGNESYFDAVKNCWEDINRHRLFITGTLSNREFLQPRGIKPGEQEDWVGEACVTVHWIYLNRLLFKITGEYKYMEALETSLYNALMGSQHPVTAAQSYFTPINGKKDYVDFSVASDFPSCCATSTNRCFSRLHKVLWGKSDRKEIGIFLYNGGSFKTEIDDISIEVKVKTEFPKDAHTKISIKIDEALEFSLVLRIPEWSKNFYARVNGSTKRYKASCCRLCRKWSDGDEVEIDFDMPVELLKDDNNHFGRRAVKRGAQILVIDEKYNDGDIEDIRIINPKEFMLKNTSGLHGGLHYSQVYEAHGAFNQSHVKLIPFSEAGLSNDNSYISWIKVKGMPTPVWERIEEDDKGWLYSGDIEVLSDDNASSGKQIYLKKGATAQYNFIGKQVKVYGMKKPEFREADIYLDDIPYKNIKWIELKNHYKKHVFKSRLMPYGSHLLRIYATDDIILDYIEVMNIR